MFTGILFEIILASSDVEERFAFCTCVAIALLIVPAIVAMLSSVVPSASALGGLLALFGAFVFIDGVMFLATEG